MLIVKIVKFICNNFDYKNYYIDFKCNVNGYDLKKSLIINIFFLPVSKYRHYPQMLRH